VQLSYEGKNHSDNSIVVRFLKERILFAVDFIPLNVEGMYRYMLVYRRPN